MSILLFSSSFGVLIGYISTAQLISTMTWQWSFYVQILVTIPVWFAILVTPLRYLDLNGDEDDVDQVSSYLNITKSN